MVVKESEIIVKKVSKRFSDVYYDKKKFNDTMETNIHLGSDVYLAKKIAKKKRVKVFIIKTLLHI